jgi:hypothetical protein
LPTGRNAGDAALNPLTQFIQEVRFANSAGYTHYRLSVNNVRNNAGENNMQIGEIEFLGIANPNPPPSFTIVPTDVAANENAMPPSPHSPPARARSLINGMTSPAAIRASPLAATTPTSRCPT